jgi:tetratricopeptide (TPR) repeat protein
MNQPSRNDLCPCGSMKKYKNCCGEKNSAKPKSMVRTNHVRDSIETIQKYIIGGEAVYAEMLCREVLSDNPIHAELNFLLASGLVMQGKIDDAIAAYQVCIRSKHDHFGALCSLGAILVDLGRAVEAEPLLKRAIILSQKSPQAYTNLGVALHRQGKTDEAIATYRRALKIDPNFSGAYYNLGNALNDRSNQSDAIDCYERAIALNPQYAAALKNLGNTLRDQGKLLESYPYYQEAIALEPKNPEAYLNLAVALQYQEALEAAMKSYRSALEIAPNDSDARMSLALLLLRMGKLEEGWKEYEFRWTKNYNPVYKRPFPQPWWQGESLAGKSILLWGEQGIGDEILFSSMFGDVITRANRCVIECAPKLLPLFVRSFPLAQVVAKTDPPHPATLDNIDFQCGSGSLGQWLRPNIDSFPTSPKGLGAAPERIAYWKARLAELGPGPKIGFSWRSSNMTRYRQLYCSKLDQWGSIFALQGVHFVSLQYDKYAAELTTAQQRFGLHLHSFEEVDLFNDLDEAAALNQALDLVISAPTSVCILSAALGVPTWMMNYGVTWETMGTEHLPWLPSVKCFNRQWNQTWDDTIERIALKLKSQYENTAVRSLN